MTDARPSTRARSWQEMYAQVQAQLERETGKDRAAWNARIAARAPVDESDLRAWLGEQGVAGYPAMLLVFETFGYPDYLRKDAGQLIEGQYRDRPNLRAIYDRIIEELPGIGEIELQARKTYVALIGPRRTFASIQATTKTRLDIGLRLDGVAPAGRLEIARSIGQSSMTHRIGLSSLKDLDAEVLRLLRRAYEANR